MSAELGLQPSSASEMVVLCPSCQARNNPVFVRCSACGADLLPGRGRHERADIAIFGFVLATALLVLAVVVAVKRWPVPLWASPLALALWAVILFVVALRLVLQETPLYERYWFRAQRHAQSVPQQALNDLDLALELAPEARKPEILKQREQVLFQLSRAPRVAEDRWAAAPAPQATDAGPLLSELTRMQMRPSPDAATEARIQVLQRQLVQMGMRRWVGYCPVCHKAVTANLDQRCDTCATRLRGIHLVRLEEEEQAVVEVNQEHERRHRRKTARGTALVVVLLALMLLPLAALVPRLAGQMATRATPTASPSATFTPATQAVFREVFLSFDYPAAWWVMGPTETSILLKTSLQDLAGAPYSYIGGVYTEGLDPCQACAQIAVIVTLDTRFAGSLSDAQYQALHTARQAEMGTRLQSQRKIEVSRLPAVESVYLDRSGNSKIWELTVVPIQPGAAYIVRCISHKDSFATFEPIFGQAMATLHISGPVPTQVPTPVRTATRAPTATPVRTYTVKAGDVLGQIAKDLGVTLEALAEANNLHDPYIIHPGQVLTVPLGTR